MQQTTSLLQQQPVVDNVLGVAGGEKINEATLYVNLTPREERERSQKQFEQQMRMAAPRCAIGVSSLYMLDLILDHLLSDV